jgi:hypothetical protein
MATFVLFSTMRVKFVVAIEALSTEATFGMTFESTLIDRTGIIIAKLFMPP